MKILYLVLTLFVTLPAFSQQQKTNYDSRLLASFELDYLNNLATTNPILIKRWTYYLDNAYYLADYSPQKFSKKLREIVISDLENINILHIERKQKIKKDWNLPVAYKIKNSEKILVYHSGKQFNEQFRKTVTKGK